MIIKFKKANNLILKNKILKKILKKFYELISINFKEKY